MLLSVLVVTLLAISASVTFLLISNLFQSFRDFLILLILRLIPIDIVFLGYCLDLFPQSIPFLYKGLPPLYIEPSSLVKLRLPAAYRKIEGRTIGYLSVMIQKPQVP